MEEWNLEACNFNLGVEKDGEEKLRGAGGGMAGLLAHTRWHTHMHTRTQSRAM